MAKGGARARSGPAPDPNALRRERDSDDWVCLPQSGREGPIPKWPLGDDIAKAQDELDALREEDEVPQGYVAAALVRLLVAKNRAKRETEIWNGEWNRPQAVMWERNEQEREVAIYVRTMVDAEQIDASTASRTLLRQQMEALGVSIPGMMRNRWKIERAQPASAAASPVAPGGSVRDHLKVVPGGQAA